MKSRFKGSWKCFALLLSVCLLGQAPQAVAADPTGDWVMKAQMDDGTAVEVNVTITKDGDEYTGSFSLMDLAEGDLRSVSLDGDKLKVEAVVDFGGQDLIVTFNGKLDGDKFTGEAEYDLAGQIGSLEVEGERKKPEVAVDPTGNWVMKAQMDDGTAVEINVTISKDGDEYKGSFSLMDLAEGDLRSISLDGDKLKVEAVVDFGGQELIVTFNGKIDGDKFAGEAEYDLAGQVGSLEVAGAREKADVDFAGVWKFNIDAGGQILEPTATIESKDGKLSGKFVGDDGQEVELEDLKVEGDAASFTIELDFGGQALVAKYNGKIDGDTYAGNLEYDLGGQIGELPFSAERQVAEVTVTLTGDWRFSIDAGGQILEPTATIRLEDGKLVGKFVADDGQEVEITDLALNGSKAEFTITVDFGGQDLIAKFKGDVDGDKIGGTIDYDIGGQVGEATFSGQRQQVMIDLVGHWLLSIDAGGQVLEPRATISSADGKLSGKFVADDGQEVELGDLVLSGDQVTFTISLDFGGQDLIAKFNGKVDGDGVKGDIEYDLAGQVGTATFTGARKKMDAVGKWNLKIETDDGGALEATLTLTKGDDGVSGTLLGPDGVELTVDELKLDGAKLAFRVTADFGGQDLVARFDGQIDGDKLSGTVDYDLGGETGKLDFEGNRAAQ